MRLRERHKALQEWLTPRRRRRTGIALIVAWIAATVVWPSSNWAWVGGPGMYLLFSAWPAELHDKR
ncbi:hypothetical protein DM807_15595 [Pseudomonas hunanensis]|nr:hypothetical protein [Pseudomonas hunanensis]